MKTYYVYIMASRSRTLYTGVTGDLAKRVLEHKRKLLRGFTARYNINRLIYFETFGHVRDAIYREKQNQGLAAGEEDRIDRVYESRLERLEHGWYGKDES